MTKTKLWDLNHTDDESDSAVSDNEGEMVSANPIAPMSAAAAAASSTKPQDHVMQETSNKEGDVDDDVEDEEEGEEIALLKPPTPKSVKETAMVTAPASTGSHCKDDDVKMSGTFNKYGKWKKEVKGEVVLCTLTPGCLLEGRHLGHCICPIDESRGRQCKPKSFAPPQRKRPNKRTKTETETVVLAAVEVSAPHPAPGLAPEIEVPTSDDEDQLVANLVSLKEGLATSSSTATACVSIAGPSTATTDDIKELAKLVVTLQEESAEVEINLMHAIAKKYRLDPANVAA